MSKGGKKKIKRSEGRSGGFGLPKADFHQQKGQRRCLLRAFETECVPLVHRTYSEKNIYSSRVSAGPHFQDHPAVLSRILDSCRLATQFSRLEPVGLFYLERSGGESASNALGQSGPLLPSIAAEWDRLAMEYFYRTCTLLRRCR
jgi:hypothetical protein